MWNKPRKGTCSNCKEEKWLKKKHPPTCERCLFEIKQNVKKLTKKVKKPILLNSVKKELQSEKDFFIELWNDPTFGRNENGERISFVTGLPLPDQESAFASYFSHVLKKGQGSYPKFKFYRRNIVYKTLEEHNLWEYYKHLIRNNPRWKHVFILEEELKNEYMELHGTR